MINTVQTIYLNELNSAVVVTMETDPYCPDPNCLSFARLFSLCSRSGSNFPVKRSKQILMVKRLFSRRDIYQEQSKKFSNSIQRDIDLKIKIMRFSDRTLAASLKKTYDYQSAIDKFWEPVL